MGLYPAALPPFPWDQLAPYAQRARAHPDGIVDLSVGTPVDPTPEVVQRALREASDSPGYPTTHGTEQLREAITGWWLRRRAVAHLDPKAVMPTVGSKEFVALLPALLGLGEGDVVVHPRAAYPTYDVGARLAGAQVLATDDIADWEHHPSVRLIWLNSPSNPTGAVTDASSMAAVVRAARRLGAVVASDECYAELAWEVEDVPSVLDPRVCGDNHTGVLAVYSLSKQSNMAGYRAAFVAGDSDLIASLVEARKHMGLMVPAMVQHATIAALGDDAHVSEQRERYARRRAQLRTAVENAGLRIDHSEAGLYLWATAGKNCWDTVEWMADRGILVAPGEFYGSESSSHVRIALTASDGAIAAASARLVTDK